MLHWLRVLMTAALVWSCAPGDAGAAGDPLVFAVQEALLDEGYDPGWPDGVLGPKTRTAIRAFETDFAMPPTGNMTPDLVQTLGLAAYASELGVMQFDSFRPLAAPAGAAPPVEVTDAAFDTDAGPPRTAPPQTAPQGQPAGGQAQPPPPAFRVRNTHPLLADRAPAARTGSITPAAMTPDRNSHTLQPEPPAGHPAAAQVGTTIPPVERRFAPRNWLIRDLQDEGAPSRPAFGVFLEEGGKVAGPRFAGRLRWQADGARFTMTYRNSIGQQIERTGWLNGLNRIEGEATGPDGRTWRWLAEAKPL